eukprot:4323421-Prymnesium_polylepis.1
MKLGIPTGDVHQYASTMEAAWLELLRVDAELTVRPMVDVQGHVQQQRRRATTANSSGQAAGVLACRAAGVLACSRSSHPQDDAR